MKFANKRSAHYYKLTTLTEQGFQKKRQHSTIKIVQLAKATPYTKRIAMQFIARITEDNSCR